MAFNIFATATSDIPLANLDANFTAIGSSAVASTLYPTATTSITYGTAGTTHYFSGSGLAVTGTLTSTLDATHYGVTVGRGAGAVANNTVVGASALAANTTGSENVAIGSEALNANTTGSRNTAVAWRALFRNTTGTSNVAVGVALPSNTTGSYNTAIGDQALQLSTTASTNTAVGYGAGASVTTGVDNVFIGSSAGNYATPSTTGTQNVVVGVSARCSGDSSTNEIVLGFDCPGVGSNYVSIGKNNNVVYNNFTSNATWTRSSDARLKRNIQDSPLGLSFISNLRPVKYQWRNSKDVPVELPNHDSKKNHMDTEVVMHGFIAQEVKAALDAENVSDFAGWSLSKDGVEAVSLEMFIMPLVNSVKELKSQLDSVKAELATLKGA